jgi:hypothetical protein
MAYARCAQETYDHLDSMVADKLRLLERKGFMPRFENGLEGLFRFRNEGLLDTHTVIEVHANDPSVEPYWEMDGRLRAQNGTVVPLETALCGGPYTIHLNMGYVRDQVARLRLERSS